MFRITLISVGKSKDRELQELVLKYIKLLSPYVSINLVELKSESFRDNSQKIKAKKIEGERIISELEKKKTGTIVLLTEQGVSFDSMTFSQKLENWGPEITFVVGGTLGLSTEVLKNFKNKLSLSSMTFPHEMARIVLLEQIYRGITILRGKEYHY